MRSLELHVQSSCFQISTYNLADDECFKINTGAPIPLHVDSVIQVEDTKVVERATNGTEQLIEIFTEPTVDLDIRPIGCDLQKGERLFSNHLVYSGAVTYKSILASVGKLTFLVSLQRLHSHFYNFTSCQ